MQQLQKQYEKLIQEPRNLGYYFTEEQTPQICLGETILENKTQRQRVLEQCSKEENGAFVNQPKDWCHCMYADYCETKDDNPFYKEDKVWQVDTCKIADLGEEGKKLRSYYESPYPYNLKDDPDDPSFDPSYGPRCRPWYQKAVVR